MHPKTRTPMKSPSPCGSMTTRAKCLLAVVLSYVVSAFSIKLCPNCGTKPVPYPFGIAPDCGNHLYKIRCNGSSLFFDSINNTYPITSISPSIQRLTVKPSPLLPNTCMTSNSGFNGLELNPSAPFNITTSNTVFYLDCPNIILMSPLNCSYNSLCHVYVNGSAMSGCPDSQVCCALQPGDSVTRYTIGFKGCRAYQSFVNLDSSLPVSKWPAPGVELEWLLPQESTCVQQGDCDPGSTCRPDPNSGSGVNRCFCNSGWQWDPVYGLCAQNYQDLKRRRIGRIAGLSTCLSVAILAAVAGILFYERHQRIKRERERLTRERQEILNDGSGKSAKVFTGKEIKKATNNFSKDCLLGVGGFGEVYKGTLEDGTLVAIKCAKVGNIKGIDQVLNEVRILCQVSHKSLVCLLGCWVELEQPILIYEYVHNGALFDHLSGEKQVFLSWRCRLRIAYQIAEGLAYLHFSAVPRIYHRYIKSSNILLDSKLNAKISDFGLSRLAQSDLSHISTCAQGTIGYLDPDYYKNYQLTDKSDVYSFGIVLLELLTSLKVIDFKREEDDINLAAYAQRLVDEERVMDLVDPMLMWEGMSNLLLQSMKAIGFLAVYCLKESRENRPSMKEVAEEIEHIISTIM